MTDTVNDDFGAELFGPATAMDPHPLYRRMRSECPVARTEMLGKATVLISGYEDVWGALRDPARFSSASMGMNLGEQPLIPVEVDPPDHTKYRRVLNPQFLPREIAKLEPRVRAIVRDLIDSFASRGTCNFHEEFATPLPSGIFLALMGLPLADLPRFLQWRDMTIRPDVERGDLDGAAHIRAQAAHEISDYFREAIEQRRAEPDDTLLSQIVHSTIDGRPLTETELLGISNLLLLGGLDTVTATLDCMVVFLATHPELRHGLVTQPERTASAVEEMLRLSTPVMVVPRTVATDCEIGDVALRTGDGVFLLIGAANGDASTFGEDAVDFDRVPNRHVAFGAGPHLCLGAHLARLELRVALEELHARIPDYRIADGAEIQYSPGIRQADHLPLEFDPS